MRTVASCSPISADLSDGLALIARDPYLLLMRFLSRFNPATGMQDFWSEFTRPNPHRWPLLGVSLAVTFALFYGFVVEKWRAPPAKPDVIYITTYAPDRSDAQIVASNIANQKKQDKIRAAAAKRQAEVENMYRQLGRATFVDVDAIDRQIARDKAAAAARKKALVGKLERKAAQQDAVKDSADKAEERVAPPSR